MVSVNGTAQGTQGDRAAVPVAASTLSQRAQQTGSPPPPPQKHSDKHGSFRVRLAVGIAIAAATALLALAAIAFYRRRRRRGEDTGKPPLRQFALGAPPASPPTALPQEVSDRTWSTPPPNMCSVLPLPHLLPNLRPPGLAYSQLNSGNSFLRCDTCHIQSPAHLRQQDWCNILLDDLAACLYLFR